VAVSEEAAPVFWPAGFEHPAKSIATDTRANQRIAFLRIKPRTSRIRDLLWERYHDFVIEQALVGSLASIIAERLFRLLVIAHQLKRPSR
jgi:hypothetical protein